MLQGVSLKPAMSKCKQWQRLFLMCCRSSLASVRHSGPLASSSSGPSYFYPCLCLSPCLCLCPSLSPCLCLSPFCLSPFCPSPSSSPYYPSCPSPPSCPSLASCLLSPSSSPEPQSGVSNHARIYSNKPRLLSRLRSLLVHAHFLSVRPSTRTSTPVLGSFCFVRFPCSGFRGDLRPCMV